MGVYTKETDPVTFLINMREYTREDCCTELQKAHACIFEESLAGTDAHATSFKERQATDSHDDNQFTYGEVLLPECTMLLDYVKPQPGEVLYDLGCGSGRPMLAASMAWPELRSCIGIELMPQVFELGNKVAQKFNSLCKQRDIPHAPVSVLHGDILQIDWSSADIIFFASVLFPVEALEAAAD